MAGVFVANTNVVELASLKDGSTGLFINNATVTCTIKQGNPAGSNLSGAVALSMAYVAGSNGTYRALLDVSLAWANGGVYYAIIDVDGGVNVQAHWELRFKAAARSVVDA